MSHGEPNEIDVEAAMMLLEIDPDLAMVAADLHTWSETHPCNCEALCECEGG